jgi:hypothetical protein
MKFKLITRECTVKLLDYKVDDNLRQIYINGAENQFPLDYINILYNHELNMDRFSALPFDDDSANSIELFEQFKNLDRVQADDKRLWVMLTHKYFFEYTRQRWKINNNTSNDTLQDRFHFEGRGIGTRTRNAVARLWWGAKLTYDESNIVDPYEITKLLWEKQDVIVALLERSMGTYNKLLLGYLKFYKANKDNISSSNHQKIIRNLNAMGGVKLAPFLAESEVFDEIRKICNYYSLNFIDP